MSELERLVDIIENGDQDEPAYERAVKTLAGMGPGVAEACVEAAVRQEDLFRRVAFGEVLARCGARSHEILVVLGTIAVAEPELGAVLLEDCGDPNGAIILRAVLEELEPGARDGEVSALCGAIETLGGKLTPGEVDKLAAAATALFGGRDVGRRVHPLVIVIEELRNKEMTPPRPNDPCWCGSEETYKDCHRRRDLAAEAPETVH